MTRDRLVYPDDLLRRMFEETGTVAVVGASSNPVRASNYVMAFLQAHGYRCIPVNPNEAGGSINGETVRARLADIAQPVQFIDVFRNSAAAGGVVDEVIAEKDRLGIRFVWMQLGVRDDAAARTAAAAGLDVVMDRCPKIEYPRLFAGRPRVPR